MLFSTDHQNYFDMWDLCTPLKKLQTLSSYLYWSVLNDQPVVLKIYKPQSDEMASVKLLEHYNGQGAVKVLKHNNNACLLQTIGEGYELVELTRQAQDALATKTFCAVVQKLHQAPKVDIGLRPIDEFIEDFDGYLAKETAPHRDVVEMMRGIFMELCANQRNKTNLHGDLHHYNVIRDNEGGWLAIDPKGLWGEAEYEIGRYLLNPLPEENISVDVVERLKIIDIELGYDMERVTKWAWCQAVLASIWADDDMEFGSKMLEVLGHPST